MYIGLDIGTSGSKADLIDRNGNVLGSGHVSYGFSKTTGGYRELDAEAVWKAAIKCLYDAAAGKHVESITVSALGEAIVPIDREGNPVRTRNHRNRYSWNRRIKRNRGSFWS